MVRKSFSLVLVVMLLLSVCTFGRVSTSGISMSGSTVLGSGAGFVGYASLSGSVVTINATLYGPITKLSCAKFGVTYNKDKVDMVKTDATTIVSAYQNSDFMTDTDVTGIATYTNVPTDFRKTLKVLVHSLPSVYFASAGFDSPLANQISRDYNPSAGAEFTVTMKFKIKTGQATDLTSIKSYFGLSGEVSAPTLITASAKKFIPVSGNFADAYVAPAIAHIDYTAIGTDPTPAPGNSVNNPTRTASPPMVGTNYVALDNFESGTPAGTVTKPADGPNSITVKGSTDKFMYFDYVYGTSAPAIRYNFASQSSGPFTVEFDYMPVDISPAPTPAQGAFSLLFFGKGNGGAGAEEWFANCSISKSDILNIAGAMGGTSGSIFPTKNTPSQMSAGTPSVKYKVQVLVKPEEQSYDVFVNGGKVSTYSFEFRHKGMLTSSMSSNYPPTGEVKFVGFQIATASGVGTYKGGFDNVKAYGGTNAGFIGYASLSGDIVTITSKLYGPLTNLSIAKFGITYKNDKVDMVKTDGTTIVNAYQNSDFLTDATISTFATYSNMPTGYRKTLKVLVHSLPTVYYASVGFEKAYSEQLSIHYSPASGNEFTTVMKFKVKAGQATDLASIKSYFNLSGEVSAPTLIVAEGKKYIPVSANFADAYLAPAMAHLDYNAIGADTTPAPSPVTNPSRTAPPEASGTTFISQDTFDSGIAGATAAPGDTGNLTSIFTRQGTGSDKYLYFDKTWPSPTPVGYGPPSIRYNFTSPASGAFTVEFDYMPVAESTAGMSLAINGKDNNGTSAEKGYIHLLLSKQSINNMAGYTAGASGNVIYDYNTHAQMLAGTATKKHKLQIHVKPEEQAYDVYLNSHKVSTYSFEYRHKGVLTSSVSPDYPPVGEVKYTSFVISTGTGVGTYKAGFDNLRSYGGMPTNVNADVQQLYVSPTGSDTNPGTTSLPFRTLERARYIIRAYNSYMTHDITVYLAQGDYYTSSTFQLTDQDSGTNGYKIIYKNKDAVGSARIIGGRNLTGWTQVTGTSMYKVNVGTGLTIGNIYENEKLGRVARYPNFKADKDYQPNAGSYLISESGDPAGYYLQYYANDLNPSGWTKFAWPASAKVVWWCYGGTPDWGMDHRQISSIDTDITQRKINFTTPFGSVVSDGTKAKDRYFIEGIYELLDTPGELYYDEPNGDLYYWPMDGNPSSSTILLPEVLSIINVAGSAIGTHVKNITFDGLYLYGSKFAISTNLGAGITLRHTDNIDIKNCHFKNIGGMGINVYEDNEYINIYGCWIEHVGTGGICVYNPLSRTTYPDAKSRYNTISNCKIQNFTELSTTATLSAGVTLYDTSDCEVSYCEIFNGGRYAISLRGNVSQFDPVDTGMHYAKDNTFKYLKLYNCGTDSGDMGTLHAAMVNATNGPNINYWNQITIDNTNAAPNMQDYEPNGIFLDHQHCCENQNFSNIKITNSQGWDYRTNVNPIQTVNNVSWTGTFVDANMQYTAIGLKSDFSSVYGTSTTATPTLEPTTLPGEIVIDNSDAGYSETGTGWVNSTLGGMKNGTGRYNNTQVATAKAIWTPTITNAGLYDVYVWKFGADTTTGNSAAKFYVNYSGKETLYSVNQKAVANRWEKLGTHYFAAGTSGNVTLACDVQYLVNAGCTRADAVKFVPVLPNDATGFWGFNEGSGTTAYDLTTNGQNGTLTNGPTYNTATGRLGASLSLDGTNDFVDVADNNNLDMGTGDFAISMWFKRDSNAATNLRMISKGAESNSDTGYAIYGSNTTITAILSNGVNERIGAIVNHLGVDKWNHIVMNCDRDGNMTIYMNGVSAGSVSISGWSANDLSNARNLNIGRSVAGQFLNWDGELDDTRVFKRLLTTAEISALYSVK